MVVDKVGEPAGKTTQTDTSSNAQSRQVAGAAERKARARSPSPKTAYPSAFSQRRPLSRMNQTFGPNQTDPSNAIFMPRRAGRSAPWPRRPASRRASRRRRRRIQLQLTIRLPPRSGSKQRTQAWEVSAGRCSSPRQRRTEARCALPLLRGDSCSTAGQVSGAGSLGCSRPPASIGEGRARRGAGVLSRLREGHHSPALLVVELESHGAQAVCERERRHIVEYRVLVVRALQVVVGDAGTEVVHVVQPDVPR